MTLCVFCHGLADRLAKVDPDRWEMALDIVIALLLEPPPIDGLTRRQRQIVHCVRSVKGRIMSKGRLGEMIDGRDPPHPKSIDAHLTHIRDRRPDIGACIVTIKDFGLQWKPPEGRDPLCDT